jgi:hypothetical protein
MTTRTTRLSVVASVVVFAASSIASTQQAYAGPFDGIGGAVDKAVGQASQASKGSGSVAGPFKPGGGSTSVKIPSGLKVGGAAGPYVPGKVGTSPEGLPKVPLPSGPMAPGPAPTPKPTPVPGGSGGLGKGGGKHWGGLGGGMAAGLIGGLALSAMAAQAAQVRPVATQGGSCWFEERRVRDAYGNRYIKEVRVCDE